IVEMGLDEIFEKLSYSIAYNSEEGIIFLMNLVDLPSQDAILFFALKNHIEHKIGRREDPAISIVDLSKNLQKKEKTISGRLSELIKQGFLRRLDRGDYVITVTGVKYLVEKIWSKKRILVRLIKSRSYLHNRDPILIQIASPSEYYSRCIF
ncbi:MAG: hypothetical protein QW655_05890, partial [Nitrososphaerota archaeon]